MATWHEAGANSAAIGAPNRSPDKAKLPKLTWVGRQRLAGVAQLLHKP